MEAAHGHIANNNFGTEEEECYLSPQEQNKILRAALRGGWKITPEQQEQIVLVSMANTQSADKRVAERAVQNITTMISQNIRLAQLVIDYQPARHQHEHHFSGSIALTAVREEILNDPKVLEALRNHQGDSDAGTVRAVSGPEMEVSETSEVPGPSHNGHANGNGRH